MNIYIHYLLSEKGRKASILAGGDGKERQVIDLPPDAPEFAAALELATISSDGKATLDAATSWDAVPTAAAVLANEAKRQADHKAYLEAHQAEADARKAQRDAEDAAKIAAYSALPLYERMTQNESGNWLAPILNLLAGSSDNVPAYIEAKIEATRLNKIADDSRAAAKAIAAETLRLEREAKGLLPGDMELPIEEGALTKVPVWESHSRGKNWLAAIKMDPSKPGGLDRDFATKAKGDYFYFVDGLKVGDPLEFGADYVSGSGKKTMNRWCGFVLSITEDMLVVRKSATGKSAIKDGEKYAAITIDKAQSN